MLSSVEVPDDVCGAFVVVVDLSQPLTRTNLETFATKVMSRFASDS